MGSTHQINVVSVHKLGYDLLAKSKRDASIVLTPFFHVFLGVRPEQITKQTCVGNISRSQDVLDRLDLLQLRRKASMHTEDFIVNECCNWKAIKTVREYFPKLDVVPPFALVVEAVDAIDACTLVVTSEQKEIFWELDLVSEQETNGLKRLFSPIDVVTKEEIVCIRRETTVLKQSQKVVVLSMHIALNVLAV